MPCSRELEAKQSVNAGLESSLAQLNAEYAKASSELEAARHRSTSLLAELAASENEERLLKTEAEEVERIRLEKKKELSNHGLYSVVLASSYILLTSGLDSVLHSVLVASPFATPKYEFRRFTLFLMYVKSETTGGMLQRRLALRQNVVGWNWKLKKRREKYLEGRI